MASLGSTFIKVAASSAILTCAIPAMSLAIGSTEKSISLAAITPDIPTAPREPIDRRSGKGDRLARWSEPLNGVVASVMTYGPAGARSILMRDARGRLAFESIQEQSTTRVAKSVTISTFDAPELSARPYGPSVRVRFPDTHQAAAPRRRVPVGCDRLVSPLVRSEGPAALGRCLT